LFKSNAVLSNYLYGREVVDIVDEFRDATRHVKCAEFVRHLKTLLPRYYSISSSPMLVRNLHISELVKFCGKRNVRRKGVRKSIMDDKFLSSWLLIKCVWAVQLIYTTLFATVEKEK